MKKKKIKKVIGLLGKFVFRNKNDTKVRNIPIEDQCKILEEKFGENCFPEMEEAYPKHLGPVSHQYNISYAEDFDVYDLKLTISELEDILKQVKSELDKNQFESVYFDFYHGVVMASALETDEEFQVRKDIINSVREKEKERKNKIKDIKKKLTDEEICILGL